MSLLSTSTTFISPKSIKAISALFQKLKLTLHSGGVPINYIMFIAWKTNLGEHITPDYKLFLHNKVTYNIQMILHIKLYLTKEH